MFALYELANSPECQEHLYSEIIEKTKKCGGQLTYEAFQEIEYLDWVLSEALRLHPPFMAMLKVCTEKYTLPKVSSNAQPLTIYPGTPVHIPITAIHRCVTFSRFTFTISILFSYYAGTLNTILSQRNSFRNDSLRKNKANGTRESTFHSATVHESVSECDSR